MRRNFVSFQMKLSVMISLFTMLVAIVLSLIDYAQLKKTIQTEKAVQYQLVEDRVIHAVKCGPRLVYSVFEQDMEGRMQRALEKLRKTTSAAPTCRVGTMRLCASSTGWIFSSSTERSKWSIRASHVKTPPSSQPRRGRCYERTACNLSGLRTKYRR